MKDFGIVTIACKHSLYGRFAWNLSLSAKANNMGIPVTLIADKEGVSVLSEHQMMLYDKIITPKDTSKPLSLKFDLYQHSPYERTLFIDADALISPLQDVMDYSESLRGVPFTIANRGYSDPDKGISEWVDKKTLAKVYPNITKWLDLSSEFIYFERTDKVKLLFDTARKHYKLDKLPMRGFAGDRPDEPYFNIAMSEVGIVPHKIPFTPMYWWPAQKRFMNAMQIKQGFFGFSAGGKDIPKPQYAIYKELCKNVAYKTGIATLNVGHKREYIPERKLM